MKVLGLLALFGFLYGWALGTPGLLDYDEACYAEVARTMHASGDYLVPRLNGEPFFEKPPLLYWTEVLGFRLLGVNALGARAGNALAAVLLLLFLYLTARGPLGEGPAFRAAVILGTSLLYAGLARFAFTDMWLTFWLFLTVLALARGRLRPRAGPWLAAGLCAGLAVLAKGAVGWVLPGATLLFLLLREQRLGFLARPRLWLPPLLLTLAVGGSWYGLLGLREGFAYLRELFLEHHVGRFTEPMQGHGGPVVYYLPVIVGGFLPWSPFLFRTGGWRRLGGAARAWLFPHLVFAVLTLVFFSLAATKLPNYVLPLFPALALWTGLAFDREGGPGFVRAAWGSALLLFLLAALFAALPWVLAALPAWLGDRVWKRPGLATPVPLGILPYGLAALAALAGAGVLRHRRAPPRAFAALAAGQAVLLALFVLAVFPRFDAHFAAPLREAARVAAAHTSPEQRVVLFGIRRAPSVLFYGRRLTRYVSRRRPEDLPRPAVGITPAGYQGLLPPPYRILHRRGGYLVFRLD